MPKKHDDIIRKLLFELLTWHGLAKLRLHTESSVINLENSTTRLGDLLRKFSEAVCPAYATKELPPEEAARVRRKAAAAAKKAKTPKKKEIKSKSESGGPTSKSKSSTRLRSFSLVTYKVHSLGWYARAIRLYGTSDNYNTQTVSIFLFLN